MKKRSLRAYSFLAILLAGIIGCSPASNNNSGAATSADLAAQSTASQKQFSSGKTIEFQDLNALDISINLDQDDFVGKYGEYFEAEFSLSSDPGVPVQWTAMDSLLPPGLDIEDTTSSTSHLFGTPEFTGTWCFTLAATSADSVGIAAREVCVSATDNDKIQYPHFKSSSYLPDAIVNQIYQAKVKVVVADSAHNSMVGDVIDNVLPDGLTITPHDSAFYFAITGKFAKPDTIRFILKATEAQSQKSNYHQFQFQVVPKHESPSCRRGYYYDPDLGYCVPDTTITCGPGTYYDPVSNSCIAYPAPPPVITCGAHQHFDDFLGYCVQDAVPSCPWGTRWDPYEYRCEQEAVSCAPGFRYNWFRHQCEWQDNDRSCGAGEHFDYHDRRCERNRESCSPGWVWNGQACKPAERPHTCGANEFWDPSRMQCVPRGQTCG
ncbi:MAG: hypothetical protein ACXVBE_17155, partial [Bdellovibrionota bacterium]